MKKKIFLIVIPLIFALYAALRINTLKQIDAYSDSFFREFSQSGEMKIQKYLSKNLEPGKASSLLKKHSQAIANFNFKRTKPDINLLLNRAIIDVTWHITIIFEKEKNDWIISELKDYGND